MNDLWKDLDAVKTFAESCSYRFKQDVPKADRDRSKVCSKCTRWFVPERSRLRNCNACQTGFRRAEKACTAHETTPVSLPRVDASPVALSQVDGTKKTGASKPWISFPADMPLWRQMAIEAALVIDGNTVDGAEPPRAIKDEHDCAVVSRYPGDAPATPRTVKPARARHDDALLRIKARLVAEGRQA